MTPTPCPATARLRSGGQTIGGRCEFDAGHEGHHRRALGDRTAMWPQPSDAAPESEGGEA